MSFDDLEKKHGALIKEQHGAAGSTVASELAALDAFQRAEQRLVKEVIWPVLTEAQLMLDRMGLQPEADERAPIKEGHGAPLNVKIAGCTTSRVRLRFHMPKSADPDKPYFAPKVSLMFLFFERKALIELHGTNVDVASHSITPYRRWTSFDPAKLTNDIVERALIVALDHYLTEQ